jgi:hypothetical protein
MREEDDYNMWGVIEDPTKEFSNSNFNLSDIKFTALFGHWPEGMVWQHRHTGQIIRLLGGKLIKDKSNGSNTATNRNVRGYSRTVVSLRA